MNLVYFLNWYYKSKSTQWLVNVVNQEILSSIMGMLNTILVIVTSIMTTFLQQFLAQD